MDGIENCRILPPSFGISTFRQPLGSIAPLHQFFPEQVEKGFRTLRFDGLELSLHGRYPASLLLRAATVSSNSG